MRNSKSIPNGKQGRGFFAFAGILLRIINQVGIFKGTVDICAL
jgi:hypothetical protein